MCAHQAVPDPLLSATTDPTPGSRLSRNQNPISSGAGTTAGISSTSGISTCTRARGNSRKYAPRTPEIAPLAPIMGSRSPASM